MFISLIEIIKCEVTRIRITDVKAICSALNMYVVFIFLLVEDDALRVYQRHTVSSTHFGVPIEIDQYPLQAASSCSLA